MSNKLIEYFDMLNKSNRIGHAFLICNTSFDNLKENLEIILSDYFFHSKISIEENPDVYIIKPENDKIVKEEILKLQEAFKSFSQINECRVYIIDGAEKMNDYASNSLLKFLEEPEKNIYAFLISSNVMKVLETIKSRCQLIMLDNVVFSSINDLSSELIDNCVSFVSKFEKSKEKTIAYIYDYFGKKEEKENIKNFVMILKYYYRDILNYKLFKKVEHFSNYSDKIEDIANKRSEKYLTNILKILVKEENMLEYNLNLGLFLDKLIIEMERVKNE